MAEVIRVARGDQPTKAGVLITRGRRNLPIGYAIAGVDPSCSVQTALSPAPRWEGQPADMPQAAMIAMAGSRGW